MSENEPKTPMVDPARASSQAYPSNSKKSKNADAKEVEVIVPIEGLVAVKAKPAWGLRFRQAFTGDDARGVFDYLLFDVAVPALKNTLYDLITGGANRALFGRGVQGGNNGSNGRGSSINYNMISRSAQTNSRNISASDRASHNFTNVVIDTRGNAELVLQTLKDKIEKYDNVTVAQLYELVNVTGSFADDNWGWFELDGADIVPARGGGFVLDLPATKPIR